MGRLALKIAAGVIGVLVLLVLGAWALLHRSDIPYATLEARWATKESKFVDLPNGLHLRYTEQGDPKAPTLVLLHGFAMSSDTWAAWEKRLGGAYHIFALDLPGFGLTQAPKGWTYTPDHYAQVVEAFARAETLDRFVIGGSSMGGGTAWRYGLDYPKRVRGIILVDAEGWPGPRSPALDAPLIKASRNPLLKGPITHLDNCPTLKRGFGYSFADTNLVTDDYVKRYCDYARAPDRRALWLDMLRVWPRGDLATSDRLAKIKAPTLILWGEQDKLLPVNDGRRFAAAIPNAHLIVYPGVGHLPQEEAADRSAGDVVGFMRSLDAAKKAPASTAPATPATPKKPSPKETIFY